jgi:hypothetical protein
VVVVEEAPRGGGQAPHRQVVVVEQVGQDVFGYGGGGVAAGQEAHAWAALAGGGELAQPQQLQPQQQAALDGPNPFLNGTLSPACAAGPFANTPVGPERGADGAPSADGDAQQQQQQQQQPQQQQRQVHHQRSDSMAGEASGGGGGGGEHTEPSFEDPPQFAAHAAPQVPAAPPALPSCHARCLPLHAPACCSSPLPPPCTPLAALLQLAGALFQEAERSLACALPARTTPSASPPVPQQPPPPEPSPTLRLLEAAERRAEEGGCPRRPACKARLSH